MALSEEDTKLEVLARATRQRAGAAEGAAVRDTDGRTYAGAQASFGDPGLDVSALRVAVALAMASGMRTFEAAVVVGELSAEASRTWAAVADGLPLHVVAP